VGRPHGALPCPSRQQGCNDAQWVGRPSADALVFTARRLRAEQLAILFGVRDSEAGRFEAAGLPELVLAGLCRDAAVKVLATMGRAAAPSVCERLLAEADGNPLALLELPGSLSQEQLNGGVPLPDAMPLTPRLEGVFRQRIGRLPRQAQTALLIAAADNTGDAPAVLRAVATLQLPVESLDPAEGSGPLQDCGAERLRPGLCPRLRSGSGADHGCSPPRRHGN
jgi:hypothetical protein